MFYSTDNNRNNISPIAKRLQVHTARMLLRSYTWCKWSPTVWPHNKVRSNQMIIFLFNLYRSSQRLLIRSVFKLHALPPASALPVFESRFQSNAYCVSIAIFSDLNVRSWLWRTTEHRELRTQWKFMSTALLVSVLQEEWERRKSWLTIKLTTKVRLHLKFM